MDVSITERLKIVPLVLAPDADRYNTDPATDIVSLKRASRAVFIIAEGAGGTGTAKIQVEECDDVTPTNSTAIAFRYRTLTTAGGLDTWADWKTAVAADGVTPAAGANKATLVEVHESDLSAGFPFVRVKLTEAEDSPVDAAVFALVLTDDMGLEIPTVLA